MKLKTKILAGLLGLLAAAGVAVAQPIITKVLAINSDDLIQVIPHGQPSAQSQYATAALLGNYGASLVGNNPDNALIGGDATTNLFQRGTTGASVTTTITYGGPDRWAYWSGTSTAMTVSRTSAAGDLPAALTYQYGFKMARTSGQTGVVQVCMMQEVETSNSLAFSGQTAEIDFHATAGANFSAASSTMTVYLITGTGTDEGVSKAAFNLNAGGGGSSTWAGQVNTGVSVVISTANQRYTVAAPVPAGTTEVAVALCYTPVGTAGTNDYIAFSGIQLTRNSALTTAAGTAGVALTNDTRAKVFARRSAGSETELQQRYFFRLTEVATTLFPHASCAVSTTSLGICFLPFPVSMRIAPTMSFTTGFAMTVAAQTSLVNCTTTALAASVSGMAAGPQGAPVSCASSAGFGAAGTAAGLYDNGGSGVISASAEL